MKTLTTQKGEENTAKAARKSFDHFRQKYPDSILIFQMGDEYQAFYEDAQVCSGTLGLDLDCLEKDDERIPFVSMHLWNFNGHLRELLQAGHNIAVCEQRGAVRTIRPGTTDDVPAPAA